ncbi:MAG: integrase arm-type DNA-binding domain-containing protein [Pseudomonadota bacterium]
MISFIRQIFGRRGPEPVLRHAPDGAAVWVLSLTVEGAGHEVVLGTSPEMTREDAQRAARNLAACARAGLDPAQEQEKHRNAAARNLHQFYC